MRKRKIKLIHMVFVLIVTFISLYPPTGTPAFARSEEKEELKTMRLVSQNSELELYVDEKDTDVAVKVKKTGDIWFTNPIDAAEDSLATPFNRQLLMSQLSVRYYNDSVQAGEMDNYNDSIKNGQFEIEYHPDGMTITYTLGDMRTRLILPDVISEERFLHFVNKMDENERRQVIRNYSYMNPDEMKADVKAENLELYPSLAERNLYVLKAGTKDYKKEELSGFFQAAGYTVEDMEYDLTENGYSAENNKPYFIIPVTYRLDGENLIVTVVPGDIEYNTEGFYLVDIDILEYFGAADAEEKGYIFVPDGSGALIYLNNGKTEKQAYISPIYGQDKTINMMINKKSEMDKNLTVKLPVFGIKRGDRALLAIIEDGEALADISADIAGRINSYNNVYAGFTFLQNGAISLSDVIGSNRFQMYAEGPYEGEYKIRYAFLSGDSATYSGMANYYRKYLINSGKLKPAPVKDSMPVYVELIGAIKKTKSFLGMKYQSAEVLTSYRQASDIVGKLRENGIKNIKLIYSGWMNGGLENKANINVKSVPGMNKGGCSLSEFTDIMAQWDIPVYYDVNLQYVYKDTLFDGFSMNIHSPAYFDNTIVKTGDYLIPNGFIIEMDTKLISPYFEDIMAEKFIKNAEKYRINGISVGRLASDLYSDFKQRRETNRQQAANLNMKAMERLSQAYERNIAAVNANACAFPYITDILEAPTDSNMFLILDEAVPFYQMVIRGYIEYAGKPLNLAADYRDDLLKAVETGSGLYFKWIYADNSLLKDTDFDKYYSVNYEYWIDKAVEAYGKINPIFSSLSGKSIVFHEKIGENLYKSIYENGTEIIVNYNDVPVKYGGVLVPGKDFCVLKEGN